MTDIRSKGPWMSGIFPSATLSMGATGMTFYSDGNFGIGMSRDYAIAEWPGYRHIVCDSAH